MATYKVSGITSQDGTPTSNLVIVYKADRDEMATYGQELGRVTANPVGEWELEFDDWSKEVLVVNLDMTTEVKFQAAVKDWVIPTVITEGSFPVEIDPYFDDVIMLMHFDGANNATDTIDEIGNPITIEKAGKLSTTQKLFGTTSFHAAEPDGYVKFPTEQLIADNFGVGDWTLEIQFWMPATGVLPSDRIFQLKDGDLVSGLYMAMDGATTMQFGVQRTGVSWSLSPSYSLTAGAFNYIVIEKFEDTFYASINGVNQWTFLYDWDIQVEAGNFAVIGGQSSGRTSNGYFDEFRLTTRSRYRGVAPEVQLEPWPDSRFEEGSEGTILDPYWYDVYSLLHLNLIGTTIIDDGPYPVPWTVQNQANVVSDAEAFGGASLYLDGTADGIVLDDQNASTLNWIHNGSGATFECRFKHDGTMANSTILANNVLSSSETGTWFGIYADGSLRLYIPRGVGGQPCIDITTATGLITGDTYYSLAFTVGDNRADIWVDGINVGGQVAAYPWPTGDATYWALIGHFTGGWDTIGWFDEVRFTKAVRYTANYLPATEAFPNGAFDPEEDISTAVPVELDPYFDDVFTRVHFDNGEGSTTIVDDTGNLVWGVVNSAQQSTAQSEYGLSSLVLDGTGDYISSGVASDWTWLHDGTTDYTLEISFRADANSNDTLFDSGGGPSSDHGILCRLNSDGSITFIMAGGHGSGNYAVSVGTGTGLITALQWHKLAVVVTGGVSAEIFLDGSSLGSAVNGFANSATVSSIPLRIGYYQALGGYDFAGYLDELRITKALRYLGTYIPATEAFPDTRFLPGYEPTILDPYFDDVKFLLHFDGVDAGTTIVDSSDFSTPVTVSGGANLSDAIVKFGSTSAGLYVNDDYISIDDALHIDLASDFTYEVWVYPTTNGALETLLHLHQNGSDGGIHIHRTAAGVLDIDNGLAASGAVGSIAMLSGEWTHVAVVKSGATIKGYINGVEGFTEAAQTYSSPPYAGQMGRFRTTLYDFTGYFDDARFTQVARYTSPFSVPTEAFPNFEYDPNEVIVVGDTPIELDPFFDKNVFLSHFDQDAPQEVINNLPLSLVGGAARVSSGMKFGTGALDVDGVTGSRVTTPSNAVLDLTGTEYTIEMWYNPSEITPGNGFDCLMGKTDVSENLDWWLFLFQGGSIYFRNLAAQEMFPPVAHGFTTGVWYHIAVVQEMNDCVLYIDGVEMSRGTSAYTITHVGDRVLNIGTLTPTTHPSHGMFDDVRITRAARYTSGFSPPTEAFPDTRFEPGYEATILDEHWKDVVLLTHFDQAAGSASSLDTSDFNTPTEFVGSAVTAQGGVFSNYLDKVGATSADRMRVDSTAFKSHFANGGRSWTIEFFFKPSQTTARATAIDWRQSGDATGLLLAQETSGLMTIYVGSTGGWVNATTLPAMTADVWYHIALVSNATDVRCYMDGNLETTHATNGVLTLGDYIEVGGETISNAFNAVVGIDELRITKAARYSANFTVPAEAFPDWEYDPNELINQVVPNIAVEADPYFDKVIFLCNPVGVHGDTTLWDSIKCEPSSNTNDNAYLDNVDPIFGDVSAKFDGSFDYFDFPDSPDWDFGSDDFCVEAWIKGDVGATGFDTWFGRWETSGKISWSLGVDYGSGIVQFTYSTNGSYQLGNDVASPAATCLTDIWYHIAAVRVGDNMTLFVDGSQVATKDVTGVVIADVATPLRIGGQAANSQYLPGRIGPMRITRGHHRYAGDFSRPTAAFPESRFERYKEPTELDPHYFNIGFHSRFEGSELDEANRLVPSLEGTAAIDVAQSKFGTTSLFCPPATFSCLQINNSDWAGFGGTEDHTIEMWYYPTGNHDANGRLFTSRNGDVINGIDMSHHTTTGSLQLNLSASGGSWTTNINFDAGLVNNTWHHLVVEKVDGYWRYYVNGVLKATSIYIPSIYWNTAEISNIGGQTTSPVRSCGGYISDVRLTPGVSRYKGNVPVPTEFYPTSYYDVAEDIATVPKVAAAYHDDTVMLITGAGVHGQTSANDLSARSEAPSFYGSTSISSEVSKDYGTSIHCPLNGWFEIPAEYGMLHLSSELQTPLHTTYGVRDFVFEAWVLIPDISAGTHYFISHGNPGSGASQSISDRRGGIFLSVDLAGKMTLTAGNLNRDGGTRYYAWMSDNLVTEGQWCHVKWVVEDGTWIPFIDGVESSISFVSGSYTNSEINRCAVYQEQTMSFNAYAVENGIKLAGANTQILSPEIFIQDMRLTFGKRPADNSLVVPNSLSLTTESYGLESEDPHWDDVVLLIKAQEETGGGSATDSSTLGNVVNFNGNVTLGKDGKFGRSIDKTGSLITDYVHISDADFYAPFQENGSTWTIEFWYKTPNVTTYDSGAFYWVDVVGSDTGIWVLQLYAGGTYDSSKLALFMCDSVGRKINFGFATDSILADTWHHYAVVRDGNEIRTFLDGKLQSVYAYSWQLFLGNGAGNGIHLNNAWNVYVTPNQTDNIRLTANVARYRYDFDKPTKPFPTQARLNPALHSPLALLSEEYDLLVDPCRNGVISSLNFSDGIIDQGSEVWTLAGGATLSALPKLSFYGDGGYLQQTPDADFDDEFDGTNSTNWTIEFRYIVGDDSTEQVLLDWRPDALDKGIVITQAFTNVDPYFDSVASLLHFDGITTEQFTEDEVSSNAWRFYGAASISNVQAKFGVSSAYFPSSGSYLRTRDCPDIGTGDFTVECWFIQTAGNSTASGIFDLRSNLSSNSTTAFVLYYNTAENVLKMNYGGSVVITSTTNSRDGSWHHLALSRVSGTTRMFIDGVQEGGDYADSADYSVGSNGMLWGNFSDNLGVGPALGHLDDCRLTIGVGRYTTGFTPATEAFLGYGENSIVAQVGDSTAGFEFSKGSSYAVSAGEEVEVALTRNGNEYLLHVNGVYEGRQITAVTPDLGALGVRFGADRVATVGTSLTGDLLRTKFSEGVSRYGTEPYLPETIAEPAVEGESSTLSLLHFDGVDGDTSTVDEAGIGWSFVSTAEISTASSKFGSSSLSVPLAIGSYIQSFEVPSFGLNDFTVECWVKIPMSASSLILFDFRTTDSFDPVGFTAYWSPNLGYIELWRAGAVAAATSDIRDDTWHHIAIVRTGGFTYLYQDGVQEGTPYADTYDYAVGVNGWIWGAQTATIGTAPLGGLIDEARISNKAKYLANFTPAAKPFQGIPYHYEREYPYLASLMHFQGTDADQFTTDVAGEASWEFLGGAEISSTSSKFGTTSLSCLTVSGDYLQTFGLREIGLQDFTVEYWFKMNTSSVTGVVFDFRDNGNNADATAFALYYASAATALNYHTGGVDRITATTNTRDGGWHHIAVCRFSGTTRLFINGVQEGGDYVDSGNYSWGDNGLVLGNNSPTLGVASMQGWMDDFRLTIGEARYLADFALPLEHPDSEILKDYDLEFVAAD